MMDHNILNNGLFFGQEINEPNVRPNLLGGKGPPHSTRLIVALHQYTHNLSLSKEKKKWTG